MSSISRRRFIELASCSALAQGIAPPVVLSGPVALTGMVLPSAGLQAATGTAAPSRIVTVGGAITETVIALGRGDGLVGVDTTSLFPDSVQRLPKVGYMRQLSPEGVLSLAPDVVIASDRAGPLTALNQLEAVGLLRLVEDVPSPKGVTDKILAVGKAIGRGADASRVAEKVMEDLRHATAVVATVPSRPRVAFLHSIGHGAPLAGGRNTPAQAMIELAGGVNAFDGFDEYKPVSPEAVVKAAPDVFLMTDRSIEGFGGPEAVLALPHVVGTPAGSNGRIVSIDGLYTLGFGPRTAHAILDLVRHLHPGIAVAPLPARPWV